jgi:hypothetical protein
MPADLTASNAVDTSIRVNGEAVLGGRLWLLGRGAMELPKDLDIPVLSAATARGSFDLIQTDVPAPAGKFLTLVPSEVNGRTVFSLRLLDLLGNAELTGASTGSFSGTAVAAATIGQPNISTGLRKRTFVRETRSEISRRASSRIANRPQMLMKSSR